MPEVTVNRRRHGRLLRMTAAVLVLLALAGYVAVHQLTSGGSVPRCAVRAASGDETYVLEPQQASNATTIGAVALSRRLPERALTIALATAMQESTLRNIGYGDRDSLGLFQQRPSQGWGSAEQIMDPVYATGKFYDRLVEIPGYTQLPLTDAAQQVQRSGFPQAYAKHEPNAALLAAALTGRESAALSCTSDSGKRKPGDPALVRERLAREFGAKALPGGTAETGAAGKSAPRSVITIPTDRGDQEGDGDASVRRGWSIAHWSVAHAAELGIEQITYQDRVWSAEESSAGWRTSHDRPTPDVHLTTA